MCKTSCCYSILLSVREDAILLMEGVPDSREAVVSESLCTNILWKGAIAGMASMR
jgi:hypothetical protein